ncbi:hypothetical protein C922_05686, partial [Plasmodium inui San Antonio 1]
KELHANIEQKEHSLFHKNSNKVNILNPKKRKKTRRSNRLNQSFKGEQKAHAYE